MAIRQFKKKNKNDLHNWNRSSKNNLFIKETKIKFHVSIKLSKTIDIIKKKYLKLKTKNKTKVTILFSPGTSSYDQYKNFEVRGNHFKKLINAI